MNYAQFLNAISLARQPSAIRLLAAIKNRGGPSLISLAGGDPNSLLFPYKEATFKLRDGTSLIINEDRMNIALQYSPSPGLPELIQFLKKFQKTYHDPPLSFDHLDICVTNGSTDAINKSFEMLITPGDNVLIENPTYAGTLAMLRPLQCTLLPVETDANGMVPESLLEILTKLPSSRRPKIMYTIPNGTNPTGASQTLSRKKTIYQISQKYNLLILEDDPYYYLQYAKERIPSYLSMDMDGRVLRFDSFSKILSAGIRVGFVTGPKPLVERIMLHVMSSELHVSTLSQILVNDLLDQWGLIGFNAQVDKVVEFYRQQKDHMIFAANKWLKDLAEWNEPLAGMFLWMRLKGIENTKKLIEEKAQKKLVLLVPGEAFSVELGKPSSYVRAAFSLSSQPKMDIAFERLAELIREELTNEEAKTTKRQI